MIINEYLKEVITNINSIHVEEMMQEQSNKTC